MPPLHIKLEHVFKVIGVPKRSRQLRIALIKYKFIFYLASYPAPSSWLLKLPIFVECADKETLINNLSIRPSYLG